MEGYLEESLMDDPTQVSILDFSGTPFSNLGGVQMKFPGLRHPGKVANAIIGYIEIM